MTSELIFGRTSDQVKTLPDNLQHQVYSLTCPEVYTQQGTHG